MPATTVRQLTRDSAAFPARLQSTSIGSVSAIGNLAILEERIIGLVCSQHCPGRVVNATYDLIQRLRDAGRTVAGGFHSPMEQECLRLLLRGSQPIVICPAREITTWRIPSVWRAGLDSGRVLVLSPFAEDDTRVTAELAAQRNRYVSTIADEVLIAHASPGSSTERLAQSLAASGASILTLDDPENVSLLELGARAIRMEDYPAQPMTHGLPLFPDERL